MNESVLGEIIESLAIFLGFIGIAALPIALWIVHRREGRRLTLWLALTTSLCFLGIAFALLSLELFHMDYFRANDALAGQISEINDAVVQVSGSISLLLLSLYLVSPRAKT